MAFVDELNIYIKAGHGGSGVVRWRHEKNKEWSGPSGGNGGTGASVYVRGVRDLNILSSYKHKKSFLAPDGEDGGNNSREGKNGEDLIINVPVGSIVTQSETGFVWSVETEGQTEKILAGGKGGLGNEHFKSSVNVNPHESTSGVVGEDGTFAIELQLIADAGFVGLPNAGKSSLLNELTAARSEVGSYQFTTLEPHLGSFFGFMIADIPGLIEGAAEGKGLGYKFLRHIKRTRIILHCVSLEEEDPYGVYTKIRNELQKFSHTLVEKREIIVLTKADTVSPDILKKTISLFQKKHSDVIAVSIIDDKSLKEFGDFLVRILQDN